MKYAIDNVITRTINKKNNILNAIYIPYNGYYEWTLRNLPIRLYAPKNSNTYDWPCNKWPENLTYLPSENISIPNRIDIDCIITNHRKHFNVKAISDTLHLPILYIDHELPNESANNSLRKYINNEIYGKNIFNACTSNIVNEEWLMDNYIPLNYGFEIYDGGLRLHDVLVVGDYHLSGNNFLNELLNCSNNVVGIGYNNNTTKYTSVEDIIEHMQKSRICISLCNPVEPPFLPLLAASCGCVVITNTTRWSKSVFKNNKNAILLENGIGNIRAIVKSILDDSDTIDEMSHEAKRLIRENFNIEKLNNSWSTIIDNIKNKVFIK